jgi:membrane-associated phospholipid phosphatase
MTKFILGRRRPSANAGPHCFSPFSDPKSSFPSGHASTAFALLTPWVVYYPSPYTYLLLIFPASTAISRMVFNRHWFTDVLTGSVLGFLIGYNLAKWHKDLAKKNNYYSNEGVSYHSISITIPIGGL